MPRRLFIFVAAVSLLVTVVSASLYWRPALDTGSPVRVVRAGDYELSAYRGRWALGLHGSGRASWSRGPSLGWVAVLAAVPPALAILLYSRGRLRPPSLEGVCRRCGYDLRATPDRCPECGAAGRAAVRPT